jgi:phage terminase large subunit-like protein
LGDELARFLLDGWSWALDARADQLPPACHDHAEPWSSWLVLGGRGAGKTRTGAEWVRALARPGSWAEGRPELRVALVGQTLGDAREVMVEGPSGILACSARDDRPTFVSSRRMLIWPSGAVGQLFSSEDPDSLRGPQFDAAWGDELAAWRHPEETWDMLQFGLRLGHRPQQVMTTTPRPIPLLKRLLKDPNVIVTRAATRANAAHLAASFIAAVEARYGGTRLGRQELEGELIDDRPDALWTRARIEEGRVTAAPPLRRVAVAVDPPASTGPRADACGIVAAGVGADGLGYVLEDATCQGLAPPAWAARAVALYRRLEADALLVETNQGGDMAAAVIREVDPGVPVTAVRALRGKYLRAEPVSVLYAQGRVRHAGAFPALEDEMCDFGPGGASRGRSPDRLDALVWALTHLMLDRRAEPRIRVL